jgi:hypothetical protein
MLGEYRYGILCRHLLVTRDVGDGRHSLTIYRRLTRVLQRAQVL